MANYLYQNDLPDNLELTGDIAVDTETKGLNIALRDRLCVVQLSSGNGDAHMVQFKDRNYKAAKNLRKLLGDNSRQFIFHYARFDVAALRLYLDVNITNIYCTKIASRLCRTYTDKHGLKDLCKDMIGKELSKKQQTSNWSGDLSKDQLKYAASDVLYLHDIRSKLNAMLEEEERQQLAQKCFDFVPTRVDLDLSGWEDVDIFHHSSSK